MKSLKKISAALAIVFSLGLFLNPALTVSAEENVTTINEQVTKDFKVGQVYHGFKLVEEKELKDYDAVGRVFEHVKSGARLVQFKNNDPNKYFAVTFRTPTDDNKGKPHVLEHSVLFGGSEKYPVKQLLNYLVNASLVNEINGYTYPDKTQYPFATVNEEEFNNLMDVYLDMAYNSRVTSCENIFKEEAWHHEITDAEAPIVDTGVVFNEMKGAMSSTSSILQTAIFRSLLPDTTYNFISAGDPKYITDLTYEELVDYYKKYYHPSNSFIFIYGDTTIDDKLKNIDDNFLSKVSKKQIDSKIKKQKPFNETKLYEAEYGISKEQPAENQDYISLNFVTGDAADFDQIVGMQVLTQLVLNNENSLLHENLKVAGFQNISASFIAQQAQTILSITASNTDRKRKDEFKKIVMDSLKQTVKDGIDKELLESVINSYELSDKLSKSYNSSTAKIYYALISMGFVYDSDMLEVFESNDKIMNTLKDATKTDYFEKLLQDKLINNKFNSLVVLKAVPGLNDTEKETEIKKLADYKASLSKEELDKLIKENIELKNWQSTIESPEILSKIPMLNVNSLTPNVEKTPLEIKRIDGVKVLYHPMYTNGTNNISLFFDTRTVKEEQIPYIQLLSQLLGNMDTEKHTQEEVEKLAINYTTGLGISANTFASMNHKNTYTPTLKFSATSLNENMLKSLDLMNEVMHETKLNDKERLKLLINQIKTGMDMNIANNAVLLGLYQNLSNNSAYYSYENKLNGIDFYNFISHLNKNFDEKYDEIVANLNEVSKSILNKNNLTVSITMEDKDYNKFENNIQTIIKKLSGEKLPQQNYKFKSSNTKEAFTIEAPINYNVQSFNYKDLGYNIKGGTEILTSVVNAFLWDSLRVKGGAYGAYFGADEDGTMKIFTYRDPRVKGSYEDINKLPEFLRNIQLNDMQMNQYKLNSLKGFYFPKSIYEKASRSDNFYFSGVSDLYLMNCIDRILNTSAEDISAFGDIIEDGLKESRITTIGNNKLIEHDKDLFDTVEPLKK